MTKLIVPGDVDRIAHYNDVFYPDESHVVDLPDEVAAVFMNAPFGYPQAPPAEAVPAQAPPKPKARALPATTEEEV